MNKSLNDVKAKLSKLWDENPVLMIVLGIASANAGAKLMQANSDRKRAKAYDRETRRLERNDKRK